jgi:hypothetical protein
VRRAYTHLEENVLSLMSRSEVERLARECGFYRRTPQQIRAFEFAICCALGAVAEGNRGFASVWRLLTAAAGIEVARSAVTQRFGPGSAKLLETLARQAIERLPMASPPEYLDKLRQFVAVLGQDGSVLKLSPLLAKLFPATRTNVVKAGGRLHATADLVQRRIVEVEITGERVSELAVARNRAITPNVLYMFDLGYASYDYFRELRDGNAELLSRLKDNANPVLVEAFHGVLSPKASVGKKLNDLLYTKSHKTFDLMADFPTSKGLLRLRVVGIYNPETEKYHCYVTSLPPDLLTVEEIADLYALRWVIELLFKLLKSFCHLDHLDTGNPDALRTHIYASILAASILTALNVAAAKSTGLPPASMSALVIGAAAPLLAIPMLLIWLGRGTTADELAAMLMRTLAIGCRDQNPARTRRKWGRLG